MVWLYQWRVASRLVYVGLCGDMGFLKSDAGGIWTHAPDFGISFNRMMKWYALTTRPQRLTDYFTHIQQTPRPPQKNLILW